MAEEGSRRLKGIDPIQLRQGREACPRCHSNMPYRRVTGKMDLWSPGTYAWFCDSCPSVTVLDGTIMPDQRAWANEEKADRDRKLKRSLGAIFKKW